MRIRGWVPPLLTLLVLLSAAAPAWPQPPEPVLGQPASWAVESDPRQDDTLSLPAGSRLFAEPMPGAAVLETLPEISLPIVERKAGWARVRYGSQLGWIAVDAPASLADEEPPAERGEPVDPGGESTQTSPRQGCLPIDSRSAARARELLGPATATSQIGLYEVVSNLADPRRIERLARLPATVARAYAERLGLEIETECPAMLLVFATENRFRSYAAIGSRVEGEDVLGHAQGGVAAIFLGLQSESQIASNLIHELTHLLNTQVLGSGLPAWLEEGLAVDLALSKISRRGELKIETVDWTLLPISSAFRGPTDQLKHIIDAHRRGELPPLAELAELERASFLGSRTPQILYAYSFLWVRFLLSNEELASGFRGFLTEVAQGFAPTPERLADHLEKSWNETEDAFQLWLRQTVTLLEAGIR